MNTNRKIIIGVISAAVIIGGGAIGCILSRTPEPADLSTIHTQASTEAPKETMPETTAPETTAAQTTAASTNVTADIETYTSGKVSIQYPVVSNMEDAAAQEKVNQHLKDNALSIIKSYELDEEKDTLEVKCKIISVDRRQITAVYTGDVMIDGGMHPTNLFYTNTLNLNQIQDMGLKDFADAYTMAGYVLSNDVKFSGISAQEEASILEYRSTQDIDTLTSIFEGADFPLGADGLWPESFSYEKQGTIYFSLPLPHALGDYVIVSFDPGTK